MKLTLRIALWSLAIVLLSGAVFWQNRTPANDVAWVDTFDEARAQAQRTDRPMMLYFTADWCGPCQKMKRTVWPDGEVEQTVNERVVPVYIDVDSEMGQKLGYEYGVQSIPTFLFTDASGRALRDEAGAELRLIGLLDKPKLMRGIGAARELN